MEHRSLPYRPRGITPVRKCLNDALSSEVCNAFFVCESVSLAHGPWRAGAATTSTDDETHDADMLAYTDTLTQGNLWFHGTPES